MKVRVQTHTGKIVEHDGTKVNIEPDTGMLVVSTDADVFVAAHAPGRWDTVVVINQNGEPTDGE